MRSFYLIEAVAIAFGVRWDSQKLNPAEQKAGLKAGEAASNPDSTLKQTESKNKPKGGTK
jgi:hypothetical protein